MHFARNLQFLLSVRLPGALPVYTIFLTPKTALKLILPSTSIRQHTNNTGQQISNNFFCICNMLLIYLFASMKLENGHKKYYLALVLKLCYAVLFYEIG